MILSSEVVVASIMEAKNTRVVKVDEVEKVIKELMDQFDKKKYDVRIIYNNLDMFQIINGYYVLRDNVDTISEMRKSLYTYSSFEDFKALDLVYDASFISKVLDKKPVHKKTPDEEFIELQKKYIKFLKKLAKENPEAAKDYAIKSLQTSGILDEEGNFKAPYNGEKVNDSDFTRGPRKSLKKKDQ